MNTPSDSAAEAKPVNPSKPILRTGETICLVALMILEVLACAAWFQSHFFKYDHSWSDPGMGVCGRTISADGRFLWQRCAIKSTEAIGEAAPGPGAEPDSGIVVGSNEGGAREVIHCGSRPVSFLYPSASQWLGFSVSARSEGDGKSILSYEWKERTVTYPFLAVALLIILLLGLLDVGIRGLRGRFRAKPA